MTNNEHLDPAQIYTKRYKLNTDCKIPDSIIGHLNFIGYTKIKVLLIIFFINIMIFYLIVNQCNFAKIKKKDAIYLHAIYAHIANI